MTSFMLARATGTPGSTSTCFLGLMEGVLVLRDSALEEEEEELELSVRVCRLLLVQRVDLDLVDGSDKDGFVVLETFAKDDCTTC